MEVKIPGYCALCIAHCGCSSIVRDGVLISVQNLPGHPTGQSLCIKGKSAPEMVYSPERILTPLKRTTPKKSLDPGWTPISWEEALDTITTTLLGIAESSGPEAITLGVTTPSATGISDSFPWIHRLANALGSPNVLFATENCIWHKDSAPRFTYGHSIGMPDYERTGCMLLWGFNPATSWRTQAELVLRAQKRGAKLIVVDPRRAGLANRADEWLRVRPATDGPLAMALAYQLISNDRYDEAFMKQWTNGPLLVRADNGELLTSELVIGDFPETSYLAWDSQQRKVIPYDPMAGRYLGATDHLALRGSFAIPTTLGELSCTTAFQLYADECSRYPAQRGEELTGVPSRQIADTARLLYESGPVSFYTWTGTAQQSQATQTGRAIALLYALTGSLDSPGGNVRFTKIPEANIMGTALLAEEQRAKRLGLDDRPLGPAASGWITSLDLYRSVVEGEPYRTRALLSFGSNPLLTKPKAKTASQALEDLEFYVHADLVLNPTASHADIVLPVASPWERSGLSFGFQVSQSAESWAQVRPAVIQPRGESRSDRWIVFELARRLGLNEAFFEGDCRAARHHRVDPSGLSLENLEAHPEGIPLPLTTQYRKFEKEGFATPTRKLEVYSERFLKCGYAPIPRFTNERPEDHDFPLRLISAKWIHFCHSQHRSIPSLRRSMPHPLVELSPQAMESRGIEDGDWVEIRTREGAIRALAKRNKSLKEDVACSQYGWEQESGGNYNALISDRIFDSISGSNTLREVRCRIEKIVVSEV